MKVMEFTAFDGTKHFTNIVTVTEQRRLADENRERYIAAGSPTPIPGSPKITILEMTEEEYFAIPATNESYNFFK